MDNPSPGDYAGYRLLGGVNVGKLRLAIIVRVQANETADLFVFGRPADGAPFLTAPAYVLNVARSTLGTAGTWDLLPPRGETRVPPFPGTGELS